MLRMERSIVSANSKILAQLRWARDRSVTNQSRALFQKMNAMVSLRNFLTITYRFVFLSEAWGKINVSPLPLRIRFFFADDKRN